MPTDWLLVVRCIAMNCIFVHGLGQEASSWDRTISLLGTGYQASSPDLFQLLGDQTADYNNLYSIFSKFCDEQTEPLNLCGLSLGAILAMQYAIEQPDRVRSIILIGAQYKMPRMLLGIQSGVFRFMPNSTFQKMGMSKSNMIQLMGSMAALDYSDRLKDIGCSALIVCGEKDKANMKAAQSLSDQIVNARLEIIAGAGHEINTEAPEKLADVIRGFWKN